MAEAMNITLESEEFVNEFVIYGDNTTTWLNPTDPQSVARAIIAAVEWRGNV